MDQDSIYLQIATAKQEKVAQAAFSLIDRLQHEKPGTQVAAITVLYTLMCEVFDLNPLHLHDYITRMVWDRAGSRYLPTFAAMKQYLQEDVKDGFRKRAAP